VYIEVRMSQHLPWKHTEEAEVQFQSLSSSALDEAWRLHSTPWLLYPWVKSPHYLLNRSLGRPQNWSKHFLREKCLALARNSPKQVLFICLFFYSFTMHLDTIKFLFLSNGCTITYSKKNVKIYIKINIKSAPTCFGLKQHHQGAWHSCFAKVTIINIVEIRR